jgi:hypothetical protein
MDTTSAVTIEPTILITKVGHKVEKWHKKNSEIHIKLHAVVWRCCI